MTISEEIKGMLAKARRYLASAKLLRLAGTESRPTKKTEVVERPYPLRHPPDFRAKRFK